MSTASASPYDAEEPFRYPLGLPAGSVRALLTLIVVGVICTDIIRQQPVELVWAETLMIALAHYFTTRRFVSLPPDVLAKLEADHILPNEPHPLYLPKGSIRFVILVAFIGVAAYEAQQGRLWQPQILSILGALIAYFIGTVVRSVREWWTRGRLQVPTRWRGDIKATIALVSLIGAAALHLAQQEKLLPPHSEHLAMAFTLYYFGSR